MKTTAEVAALYNVIPRRIRAIASDRGIRPKYEVGGSYLWSEDQVKRLEPKASGRPKRPPGRAQS